jgi:hypothetical protein
MKKIYFFSVFLCFLWGNSSQALYDFSDNADIPEWGKSSVDMVRSQNIMTGFGDATFRPDKVLNRAEALVLLLRTKEIDFQDSSRTAEKQFSDVPRGEWFSGAVAEAVEREWITGFEDGTFRPARSINRAEWAILVKRVFELTREENPGFADVPNKAWFSEPVFNLAANDLIREKRNKFNPADEVSRVDAAWTIAQILQKPRLMGKSATNTFSKGSFRGARRVAIKPRDFNANKQGYNIEKQQLKITASGREEPKIITKESDWVDLGSLRVANNLKDRAELHSLEFKLRFRQTNMGPAENFILFLRGGGITKEQVIGRTGNAFLGGLNIPIPAGQERVFRVLLKPDNTKSFYTTVGEATFSVFLADGSMISTFSRENPDRTTGYRTAPVGFEKRELTPIRFEP